jgi:hypothetical protein
MRQAEDSIVKPAAARDQPARIAAVRLLVLLSLAVWTFWPEFRLASHDIFTSGEWSHALALPFLVLLLVYRRRGVLRAGLSAGSVWGVLVLVLGLGLLAGNVWPFDYGYLRALALVPVCAGAVLATCGWRVLKRSLPLLLLLWLSIPIGARQYAALIIRPETHTVAAARFALDALPGVSVRQSGTDLDFAIEGRSGTVALGEPRRGASLLVTYVVVGVCVVFAAIRPAWQVVLLAFSAGPIALVCNLFRLLCWGSIAIYVTPDPTSAWPRAASAIAALLLAYVSFAAVGHILAHLVEPLDDVPARPETPAGEE